jgi:hypothetical protein
MNSSGLPNDSTSGLASGMARVSPTAPRIPPAIDDRNDSDSARVACPLRAIAYPSSIVTLADAEPGAPSSTAART